MHTYIYIYIFCVYLYILYIYIILQASVCSFSNTIKANFQTLHHHHSPYLQRNDTLMWHLAVFHILYKILIKVKEQFARKLFENSFHFHIRALMGIGIIWQYKNDLEFGA